MTARSDAKVSILLVNYNGLAHLDECLSSVCAQTYPGLEIIMVDNGSKDGSAEHVERAFSAVKVIRAGANLGFAGGNNFGLPHCTGDFVFFLNNDTRLEPGTVANLMAAVSEHPDVEAFGCLLLDYRDPSKVDSAGDTLYDTGGVFSFHGYPASLFDRPRFITSACAGAALYSRALLERLGGFDEDFFLNFEDMDLSLRARHLGHRILFVPSARVHHKGSATLGGKMSALSFYYSERNLPLLLLKTFPLPNLARMLPAFLLLKAMRGITAARQGQLGAYLRGNLGALALAPRMLAKRRRILAESRLSSGEFQALLRKNWLKERRAFKRGDYAIQP